MTAQRAAKTGTTAPRRCMILAIASLAFIAAMNIGMQFDSWNWFGAAKINFSGQQRMVTNKVMLVVREKKLQEKQQQQQQQQQQNIPIHNTTSAASSSSSSIVVTYSEALGAVDGEEDEDEKEETQLQQQILPPQSVRRFCRNKELTFPSSAPVRNPSTSTDRSSNKVTIVIDYQCDGQAYTNFTNSMLGYIERIGNTEEEKASFSWWGRREYPFPNNTSILVMGNSHARQTIYALVCQYGHKIIAVQNLGAVGPSSSSSKSIPGQFQSIRFTNNSTLTLVANSPLVYPAQWATLINNYTNKTIQSYDAIVLGRFNMYSESSTDNAFKRDMASYFAGHAYLTKSMKSRGPLVGDIANLYNNGPIISLPMYAQYSEKHTMADATAAMKKFKQNNIVLLSGRKHVHVLGECGSDGRTEIGPCLMAGDKTKYGRTPENMHRCTGPSGGHADLLAWDLIEALHSNVIK